MTTADLITQRKQIFSQMCELYQIAGRNDCDLGDELEALAALRHLHDATCREIDYADLEVGIDSYALDILRELDELEEDRECPMKFIDATRRVRTILFKLFPKVGEA